METHRDENAMNLFIDILADMVDHYIAVEEERQMRANFWLAYFKSIGVEAQIVV